MKLSICTDVMGNLSFTEMLDKCVALGVEGIEMTGGGWSKGPHFRADETLRNNFFSRLKVLFYAGAGLNQATRDALTELAVDTTGERIIFLTPPGSTETAMWCRPPSVSR